jgi:tetratricopeptide (TPR) repeat protein
MTPWTWFSKSDQILPPSADRNLQKQVKSLEKTRRDYRRKEDYSGEARILDDIALVLFQAAHYESALMHWKDALRIHQETNNRICMSEIYTKMANTCRRQSNLQEAARFYKKSLIIDREFNQGEGVLLSLHNLGSVWLELCEYDQASTCFSEALDTAREHQLKEWESYTLARLGITFRRLYRYIDAFNFLDTGLKIAETIQILDLMTLNIIGLGALYEDIGEYGQALKCYTDAIIGSQNLKESTLHAESLTCMAALKLHIGCLDEARQIAKTVHDIIPGDKPSSTRINLDLLRSEIYYSRGMKEKSKTLIEGILSLSDSVSSADGCIRAHIQLAVMEIDRNRFPSAKDIMGSIEKKGIKSCNILTEIDRLIVSGRICIGLGNLDEACSIQEHAVARAESTRIPRYLWSAHYNLARVFDLQQRHQLAKNEYEHAEKVVYHTALTLDPQLRKTFLEHKDREVLYQHYILLLLKLGHKEQAIRILNRLDSPGLNRRLGHFFGE